MASISKDAKEWMYSEMYFPYAKSDDKKKSSISKELFNLEKTIDNKRSSNEVTFPFSKYERFSFSK